MEQARSSGRESRDSASRKTPEPAPAPSEAGEAGLDLLEALTPPGLRAAPRLAPRNALAFQRVVGNTAVQRAIALQRNGTETALTPRQQIDAALTDGLPASVAAISDFSPATDAERVQLLETLLGQIAVVAGGTLPREQASAARRIWESFGANRQRMAIEQSDLWDRCQQAGANLPDSWLGAARGSRQVNVNEQVGGTVYGVRGAYAYRIRSDSIVISVGMNFQPDAGVTVPVSTWFGYIRSTWNGFKAVNARDRTQQKNIEFNPIQGSPHNIQVSAGTGRANAGHFYVGDSRAPQTIPHEFGHLIGLEDEYERDAPDFERLTGTTVAPAGTGDVATAQRVARGIHDGLMLPERVFEWHSTCIRRRQQAVQKVLDDNRIVANYQAGQTPLTNEVARQYARLYGHEMSVDFMNQIKPRWFWEDSRAYQDWRERVLGSFQYTSSSIMGDMSNHAHPVEPRHVRNFAQIINTALPGDWQPEPR